MNDFYPQMFSESPIPEAVLPDRGAPRAPRSNGLGCRVISSARAKKGFFAIMVNRSETIGELWVLAWSAAFRNREVMGAGTYHGR